MEMKLGEYLKQQRRLKNLTLRSVQEKTGISNAYLSQVENNKISKPSPSILHKLADCYGTSYKYLMELAGYPLPDVNGDDLRKQYNRLGSAIDKITPDEEEKLVEYLEFLRSIKRK